MSSSYGEGTTLFSEQGSDFGGNGAINFYSAGYTQASSYGGAQTEEPVQFCLQSDNSFVVQNPAVNGANVVMQCGGTIYLYTAGNAMGLTGCSTVILSMAYAMEALV